MLDVAVDAGHPGHLVAVSSEGVLASRDAGATWRPLGSGFGTRLAWARPDALFRDRRRRPRAA
jgi:hypothetical protein